MKGRSILKREEVSMKRRNSLITILSLILTIFLIFPTTAYSYDDYNRVGNQTLGNGIFKDGDFSVTEAQLRNVIEYFLDFVDFSSPEHEDLFFDQFVNDVSSQNPFFGVVTKVALDFYTAADGMIEAWEDYFIAMKNLDKERVKELIENINYAEGVLEGQLEMMATAYETGKKHRNSDEKVPIEGLIKASNIQKNILKNFDNYIEEINNKITSVTIDLRGIHYKVNNEYVIIKNILEEYREKIYPLVYEYPSLINLYALGRYELVDDEASLEKNVYSQQETAIIVNCKTYFAGFNKNLTGGSAFTINAGELVYIEGYDYGNDGVLRYYVRTEYDEYGWISANFLQINNGFIPANQHKEDNKKTLSEKEASSEQETAIIVNCKTYFAGFNKNLTGGSAFTINAGELVYIEGYDYGNDGVLRYYVRTEHDEYGWISANYLQIH